MKSLSAKKIRTEFLEYFHGQGHQRVRSSSLIPSNDPTVLLTTAGMQQFKPYFLGEQKPPAGRLTTAQKCFRTSDIEEVGDSTHDTFFEMLGNFSVGDYFKKEAITFAWDLLVGEWAIPPERLSITVFGGYDSLPPDEEAEHLWKARGVPVERIYRFGPKDNFWGPPGVTGPCGPCSEIHYDLTQVPCSAPSCGPNCECGRFLEIWNLVFMEYKKQEQGNFDPLPSKNIDTGMGLERIALVLQQKENIFATDLFAPILEAVEQLCRFSLKGADEAVVRSSRIIADHIRAATFLVSDGVLPSNDGRGYVLRRILRKALVHGHCHQKSFGVMDSVVAVLRRIPSLDVEVIPSGCCGMAGAFGYDAAHYDVSMRIGEASLLPAVRQADAETVIVADGTSCRHQIHDGAAREARH
ncbi:MAG: alanine--tRNA ligase-related protein, partial [Thermodesulfobacteriota bacterium]